MEKNHLKSCGLVEWVNVAHSRFYTTGWAKKVAWPHFPPRKKFLSVQFKLCVTSNYTCADECRLLSFYIWTGLFRVSKPLNSWFIAPPPLPQQFGTKWPDNFSKDDYDPGQLLSHFQNSFTEYGGHFLAHHVLGKHKFACCGSLRYCRRDVNAAACSGEMCGGGEYVRQSMGLLEKQNAADGEWVNAWVDLYSA